MKRSIIYILLSSCLVALLPAIGSSQNFVDETADVSVVPIELLSFKAVLQGSNVQVSWSTATETNNSHFNVLRSLNGKDFSSIGTVQGRGTSSTVSNYTWVDAAFPKQDLYYQVEQVDLDGRKTLSAIVLVKLGTDNQIQLTLFPNPVRNHKLSIMLYNAVAGSYALSLVSLTGAVVYSQQWKAVNNVPFTMQLPAQLPAGIYTVQVQSANTKLAKQLLID